MIPDLPTHFEKLSDVLKFRLQETDLSYWLRKPPQRHDSPGELFRMSGRLYRAGFSEYEREQIDGIHFFEPPEELVRAMG